MKPEDNNEISPAPSEVSKRLAEWEVLMREVISRKTALDLARLACWTAKTPEEYSAALEAMMRLLQQRAAEVMESN